MGSLGDYLMEELSLKTSFTIPIGGGIPVPQSAVTTWVIMAIIVLLCIIFVRNLKVIPEGPQVYVEALVGFIYNFIGGLVGEKGKRYIPFLGTILIYLGVCKYFGIFQSETANERSERYRRISDHQFVFDHIFGIHEKGLKGYIHSYVEPMPMMAAINILELFTRPLSLCMRLFGNVLGAFVLMELITHIAPAIVPLPFSCYFDFFDGLLQAYVFVLLTSLFISESIE